MTAASKRGAANPAAATAAAWREPYIATDVLTPILANALDAFHEVGYHGTSVRDIARRSGITVPAVYYHHENKEALLFTLLEGSINSVIARCRLALEDAPQRPEARLANLVECLALYMTQQGKRAAMDAEIRALSPANRRRYVARRQVVEQLMESAISDGVALKVFAPQPVKETSRALLGMLWAITVWYHPGGRMSPEAVAASYVDIALRSVGAVDK